MVHRWRPPGIIETFATRRYWFLEPFYGGTQNPLESLQEDGDTYMDVELCEVVVVPPRWNIRLRLRFVIRKILIEVTEEI